MATHRRVGEVPGDAAPTAVLAVNPAMTPRRRLVHGALATSACLHGFAASSVATAVPAISASFHVGIRAGEAVVTAFFLGAAVGVLGAGRVADVFGPRRLLLGGLGVVLIAALGSAMASSLPELIAARLVIGIGTASVYPAVIALLAVVNVEQGTAPTAGLPLIVGASEALFGAGPAVGGALVTANGWRPGCVLLAVPALAAIVLVRLAFPPEADRAGSGRARSAPGAGARRGRLGERVSELDPVGLMLAVAAATAAATMLLGPALLDSPTVVLPTVLCLLIALLVWHSRRVPTPAVDLKVLCSRPIKLGLTRTVLVYGGVYATIYGLPLWLTQRGWGAERIGAALLPVAAVSALAVLVSRRAVRTHGPVPPLLAGAGALVLVGVGLMLLPVVPVGGVGVAVLSSLAALGVTCGCANLSTQHGSVAASPQDRVGGVASWSRLTQFLAGQAASVVVVQALPGTDSGVRMIAGLVVGLGVLLAATAWISPTLQGEQS